MGHVEKLIMTRLHKWVFCHDSCDDEQKDLALQRRIRFDPDPDPDPDHLKTSWWTLTCACTPQLLKLGHPSNAECPYS